MGLAQPTAATVEAAIAMAVRAPSVHNTQPWRRQVRDRTIDLYADPSRQLTATDPQQRGLILSCGAALHHLRVALAVLGWSAEVRQLPNPADRDHLASVELHPHVPQPIDFELAAALMHRQTDRRRYGDWQVPPGYIRTISARAARFGAVVRHVPAGLRYPLARPTTAAVHRHVADTDYQTELAAWSGRHGTTDGVPAQNTPRPRPGDAIPARLFSAPELADHHEQPDAAEWLAVCTVADDRQAPPRPRPERPVPTQRYPAGH